MGAVDTFSFQARVVTDKCCITASEISVTYLRDCKDIQYKALVKFSRDRPRWPKGLR
jgi:hypothetical protein